MPAYIASLVPPAFKPEGLTCPAKDWRRAMTDQPLVFPGSASTELTRAICEYLGLPIGQITARQFEDGETFIKIEENVRGKKCFVVQSTCAPVNKNVMELLLIIDALRRASAATVSAVIPYFGYSRQDRKDEGRVPLSAKLVANLITTAGADRVLTMDLHSAQIQGFFDIPVDHLYAHPVMVDHVRRLNIPNVSVVSPDVGNVKRARSYAASLEAPLVIIDKRRPKANVAEVMNIIGDIQGRNAILFDDLVDTAGTLCNAVAALKTKDVNDVYAACTHAVLSGKAYERLEAAGLRKIFVTDTIPLRSDKTLDNIEVVTVSSLLGEAIRRIHGNESVSALFR
jgi:ribose-phosphate pyrophosphokinase